MTVLEPRQETTGCSEVLASPYSRILGVPLAAIGVGMYLALAFLPLKARRPERGEEAMRTRSLVGKQK